MYRLVISEKPSVAMSIAKVLGATARKEGHMEGGGWLVSWCIGHLAGLAEPAVYNPSYDKWRREDLPILPENWRFIIGKDKREQFDVLRTLLRRKDVSEVVNACDAGREGELIFRTAYHLAGCTKPMRRLWISSMEDSAIREGFENLHPGQDYDGLHQAALCRQKADWLVGINATRLFSVLYGRTLNIGRVMSPTLALIVQREAEIAAFEPVPFYTVELDCGGVTLTGERADCKEDAAACEGGTVSVQTWEHREKSEKPPALYDLTTLQRDANRILGYTAQQTLDYLQALYEKKLCTYPRTDSRYLTDDMESAVPALVSAAVTICGAEVAGTISAAQVCSSAKVSDHHAVVPTTSAVAADLTALPLGEHEILRLVSLSLIRAVCPPYRYTETSLTAECDGQTFSAKGKTVLDLGWRVYAPPSEDAALPDTLAEGQTLAVDAVQVKEGKTAPPKHFTEDTILQSMETAGAGEMPEDAERKGIGTPTTRASILEELVATGLVERKKAKKITNLLPTQAGSSLVTVLPEVLQSPLLTADWEQRLGEVERGELSPEDFMAGIAAMVDELVKTYRPVPGAEVLFPSGKEAVGPCPRCGGAVIESKKGFFCENREYRFVLWKDSKFFTAKKKALTKAAAAALLNKGRVRLTGCFSEKTGKTYDATVVLEDDGERTNYKLVFDNG
ncbi:DNA topoisomerase [uncultured Oscillibacter sp.]|uniref:DNA topoisomerase n=1 Tax=uncultured Oscillibacter sp. TaxID=876091 RepID=UPI00261BA7B5|nr:DNA topoisomerase [uncultured Oscillibacter sp.]